MSGLGRVVTAVVRRAVDGRLLLLRRSESVASFAGRWHFVSGSAEPSDGRALERRVCIELREEIGLGSERVRLHRFGRPLAVPPFLVHPMLVDVSGPFTPVLNWENTAFRWVSPAELAAELERDETRAVPYLTETLQRVLTAASAEADAFEGGSLQRIRDDRVHGATELAASARRALLEWRASREMVMYSGWRLATVRPDMAAIATGIGRVLPGPIDGLAERVSGEEARVQTALDSVCARMVQRIERYRPERGALVVMTCSYSSTVLRVLTAIGGGVAVIVAESRPLNEGVQLARDLLAAGIASVELSTDAQMAVDVQRSDVVLVGADSVGSAGVVNKVGTMLLALAAADCDVPMFAVTVSDKVGDALDRRMQQVGFDGEENSPDEVLSEKERRQSGLARLGVRNVYFEATRLDLFAAVVTEEGELDPVMARQYVRLQDAHLEHVLYTP